MLKIGTSQVRINQETVRQIGTNKKYIGRLHIRKVDILKYTVFKLDMIHHLVKKI